MAASKCAKYPEWLNNEFFSGVVKKSDKCDREAKILNISSANDKGENYSSVMLRAEVEISPNSDNSCGIRKYIVKLDPEGISQQVLNQFNVFPKEIAVYDSLIPKFEEIYRTAINEEVKLGPKCLLTSTSDEQGNVLVLEDLCDQGYRTVDRQKGLDLNHAQLALSSLAKFHAASAVYYQDVSLRQHKSMRKIIFNFLISILIPHHPFIR